MREKAGQTICRGFKGDRSFPHAVLVGQLRNCLSGMFERPRMHGSIRKVEGSCRYHITRLGEEVVTSALKPRTMFIIPCLAKPAAMRMVYDHFAKNIIKKGLKTKGL